MFIVKMSNCEIQIDRDEIKNVIDGVSRGVVKILKRGVFNPSFFVAIIPDTERAKIDIIKERDTNGHYTGRTMPKPLSDLFPELRDGVKKLAAKGKE